MECLDSLLQTNDFMPSAIESIRNFTNNDMGFEDLIEEILEFGNPELSEIAEELLDTFCCI